MWRIGRSSAGTDTTVVTAARAYQASHNEGSDSLQFVPLLTATADDFQPVRFAQTRASPFEARSKLPTT